MKPYIFFDMDGTLLNMGESHFEQEYMKRMVLFFEQRFPGKGKDIVKAVGYGGEVMKRADGTVTNAIAFWQAFEQISGLQRADLEPLFIAYYTTAFAGIGDDYIPDESMVKLVQLLEQKGYQLVVATNPLVPQIANQQRVRWAGLADIGWKEITSFEHYHSTKPNLAFYQEICQRLGVAPEQCVMVGNSVKDDGVVRELGMDFYLLLGENDPEDIAGYDGPQGTRAELLALVEQLPSLA